MSPAALRQRVAMAIAYQEIRDAVFGWSLYLTVAVAVLGGTLLLYNATRAVGESGLEIVARPFYQPLLVATSLATVYLAGWATLAIARPRDQGSLRVLFFAPVDPVSLLGALMLAALAVYALFMFVTIPVFALLSLLVNLPLPPLLLVGMLVSPAFAAPAIAIGLFISAVAGTSRGAMFLFGIAVVLAIGVQIGYSALQGVPPASQYYDTLLFLREVLRAAREALRWVSPLALVSAGLDAALRADWRELLVAALAGIGGSAVWLVLAGWALRRRGVLP
ncbi:MAG: hypothetical protein H0V00_18825 [Chloroflexia bacterium]|nr:hypothetical protein [Chloroflexia bacterium]